MAAAYCHHVIQDDARPYQLVWWIAAETREASVQSLIELVSELKERSDDPDQELPQSIATEYQLRQVAQCESGATDWTKALLKLPSGSKASRLLVYDNYSKQHPVDEFIPQASSSPARRHHVLRTTRDASSKFPLPVRLWMEPRAENPYLVSERFFFEKVFPSFKKAKDVPALLLPQQACKCGQQVRDVCRRADGLPLALSLIAQDLCSEWQRNQLDYDLTDILSKWEQLAFQTNVTVEGGNSKARRDQTMDAILLVSVSKLRERDALLADKVDKVVSMLGYVAADNIPFQELGWDITTVEWLAERSLLQQNRSVYSVHRLTQAAMRRRQEASGNAKTANQAVLVLLGKAMPSDDEKLRQRVRVHAAIAMSRAQRAGVEIPDEVKDVLQKLFVRAAIDDEDIEQLQKIHIDNPAIMAQRDEEGLHAFHRAFNIGRPRVMLWLVSEVDEFRDPSTIKPTKGCSLEKLNLNTRRIDDAGLAKLAALLGALTKLTTLSLGNNQLTSVPKELGALTNLTTLWLANNQLTSLATELRALTLSYLNLRHNQLTSLPTEVGALTNLTTLYLHNNQLTSVPTELGALTNLTELSLANNQLTSVPKELGALTNLTGLWLHNNQLTSVPTELGALTNLAKLSLHNNQLTSDDIPAPLQARAKSGALALYL